jgi:putative nucleotidyltransferase with HDIG domain
MSLGKRRTRTLRAVLRPNNPIDLERERQVRRRSRLTRLGLVGGAILLTAALVHGTGPAFPYRLGQKPAREIRVNVPAFQLMNQRKTNAAIQEAADRVAPIMDNDPEPIRELARRLIDLTEAVARAPERRALPEPDRSGWSLDQVSFDDLKTATDTPERRDDLKRRITAAFEPLARDGILGPDTLPRHEESTREVVVRTPGIAPHAVTLDRIKPERLIKPDGPVATSFAASFSNPELGRRLFALAAERLRGTPTLTFDERGTATARKQARDGVRDVYDLYERGDLLVEQDQAINEDHLVQLRREHEVAIENQSWGARIRRAGAITLIVGALYALIGYYVLRHEPRAASSLPRVAALCGLVAGAMAVVRLLGLQPWDAELIPVALSAMVLSIAYNPHFALIVAFALSLMTSLALGSGLAHFIVLMGGTAAAVLPLGEVRTRTKPIQVGAAAALGYFVLTWATGLWQGQPFELILSDSLWRAAWGLMAGFFLGGLLPFVETAFGIVTSISLLELGDITHPLLQELVRRAPGTHNHSVAVGTIAEAAAERVGANAVLVRVGAYFHDIGKMLKPHYFIENQSGGVNRHTNLAPAMSTLIIIGHVKDGVDLARQHNLPEPIIDLIEQHHGTTLVEFFYREASRRSGANPDEAAVPESSFRYPGPKPQTKEAGILMMSDAVESASRTLSEPTPGRIEGLVSSLIDKRLRDGQFDECGLTLREIAEIRDSLIKSLIGIYHGRVVYPEQRSA